MSSFWERTWLLAKDLAESAPADLDAQSVVAELSEDFLLQEYLFVHKRWADVAWFDAFVRFGLFEAAPAVERTGNTIRARGWPAMSYLKSVADQDPQRTAAIVTNLTTDNWWVISDLLEISSELPDDYATEAITHVLALWQAAPTAWTSPETMSRALLRLATDPPGRLPLGIARLAAHAWDDQTGGYELDETLGRLLNAAPAVRFRVADGIELAIATRPRDTNGRTYLLSGRLLDADSDRSDTESVLARRWSRIVEDEASSFGSSCSLQRAVRLLASDRALLHEMGLRCLGFALAGSDADPMTLAALQEVVDQPDFLTRTWDMSETVPLLRDHFGKLGDESKLRILDALTAMANSNTELEPLLARDWLTALRQHLGPRESQLSTKLGEGRQDFGRQHTSVRFVEPELPIPKADLSALRVEELIPILRHISPLKSDWRGSSTEAIAAVMKTEVERRPDEFVPALTRIADEVGYPAIIHHILWGLKEVYRDESRRDEDAIHALMSFMARVSAYADNGRYDDVATDAYDSRSVLLGIADALDDLATWIAAESDSATLAKILHSVVSSPHPTAEYEQEYGGSNMDPPTLALNTARGRGTRSMLRLLIAASGAPGRESQTYGFLAALAIETAASEQSPSVLSSYGLFLPWLVVHCGDVWKAVSPRVLSPSNEDKRIWEAVVATFISFNGATRQLSAALMPSYELAIKRLGEADLAYLSSHASQLITHLLALNIQSDDSDDGRLLLDALRAAPPDAARDALLDLAHAVRRGEVPLDGDWIVGLVGRRLTSSTVSPEEATGFLELLTIARVGPSQCGGELLALMRHGGSVRTSTLVDYLEEADVPRSGTGVQILLDAIRQDRFDGYLRNRDQLSALLEDYATESPALAWTLVNELGEKGGFFAEGAALRLATSRDWDA